MEAGLRPELLGSLSAPPDPLAAVKGLWPPGGEGKEKGKGRRKGRREGRGGEEGREGKGMRGRERKGEGMGRDGKGWERRGPQCKKNDPPSSDGWLRACSYLIVRHFRR